MQDNLQKFIANAQAISLRDSERQLCRTELVAIMSHESFFEPQTTSAAKSFFSEVEEIRLGDMERELCRAELLAITKEEVSESFELSMEVKSFFAAAQSISLSALEKEVSTAQVMSSSEEKSALEYEEKDDIRLDLLGFMSDYPTRASAPLTALQAFTPSIQSNLFGLLKPFSF